MYIQKVVLQNVQSHKHLTLDIRELTFIVGPSNVGKTAIVRALAWFASLFPYNIQTKGTKRMKVSVTTPRATITKTKGESIRYEVRHVDGRVETYERAGREVPSIVLKLLPLSSLNFQFQFEPHFLIFSPPSEINKTVLEGEKEIVTLDKMIEILRRKVNETNATIKVLESNVKSNQGVVEIVKRLKQLHKKEALKELQKLTKAQLLLTHLRKLVLLKEFHSLTQHHNLLHRLVKLLTLRELLTLTQHHNLLHRLRLLLLLGELHRLKTVEQRLTILYGLVCLKELKECLAECSIKCPNCGTTISLLEDGV